MRADLRRSELCAIDLLCRQTFTSFYDLAHPCIPDLILPVSVVFDSFSSYCEKTGKDRADLGRGAEGLTLRHAGTYIILYDEQIENERRRAFTLAHEVGHILLSHSGEEPAREEREANAFAAALLCPGIAVRYFEHQRGRTMSKEDLFAHFFLSAEAAETRHRDLHRTPPKPPTEGEIALLLRLFGRVPFETKGESI